MAFPSCLYILLLSSFNLVATYTVFSSDPKNYCPGLLNSVLTGYVPAGKDKAGVYKKFTDSSEGGDVLKDCADFCCQEPKCNVILMHVSTNTCYWISCYNNRECIPVQQSYESDKSSPTQMVLVRPLDPAVYWRDVFTINIDGNGDDFEMSGSNVDAVIACPPCGENLVCSEGVCICKPGFVESPVTHMCLPLTHPEVFNRSLLKVQSKIVPSYPKIDDDSVMEEETRKEDQGNQKLVVSVVSKEIWLPDNEATLSAFVIPEDSAGKNLYSYKWEPISKPEESGRSTSEVKGNTLKLSHLTQGLYTFKVTVTGANNASGVALANLTVLPQSCENKPPVAIVRPRLQTVKLPNSRAVLDASGSYDDTGKLTFNWELQQGPLGFQLNITHSETLLLNNLEKSGNYTFKLTVRDEEGASNSTDAKVEVLEEPDYPPVANAGPSVVLYLPRNNITLNGSLSSDDKGITSWEWTKSPSDHDKAVDMQNTHTPYLQLSLLTEGLYTFVLKVTDEAGQFSSSETLVLVKPPSNKPPTANAGGNITIGLPRTWVQLNGSSSADDISITQWQWRQISGPNSAVFENGSNKSVTNVTGLTKGDYQFELSVIDSSGNTASDTTFVIVTQSVNAGPRADAGGDQTLIMPVDVLIVNGSKSTDDLRITSWQWTREPTSLAIGTIINHSDKSPVLMLTNIVTGRYEFRLRVTDDQGEFAEDTVSIIVKQDTELLNLVEMELNIDPRQLMESQRDSVLAKLGLLLRDASQLVVRDLRPDPSQSRVSLVFYVSGPEGKALAGPSVVSSLKESLEKDTSLLLPLSVASLRTLVCQNNCSGHGVCIQSSRACLCEAFWMEDLINKYFGDEEANCDWSILYVLIGLILVMVLTVVLAWSTSCLIQSVCCPKISQPNNKNKYSLLDSTDQIKKKLSKRMFRFRKFQNRTKNSGYNEDIDINALVPINKVIMSEDSDETDSDVLFESSRQPTSGRSRSKTYRNGFKPDSRANRLKT